ncbi:hypothetical protein ACHAW6_001782, partial [Cyclotella cf. meneghiniana]
MGVEFPSHAEQCLIAEGFKRKSAVPFDKCDMTMDGMLVWMGQPNAPNFKLVGIGQRSFHCYRKDKFGMLLLAGCDHMYYTAWLRSDLGMQSEQPTQTVIALGYTIFGDNTFVESDYMSIPIPEGAFEILVHQFVILRAPLLISNKVPTLVMCLMRLHNFYIDKDDRKTVGGLEEDEAM